MPNAASTGPLVLIGSGSSADVPPITDELLDYCGGDVLVLPTAAAYERPDRAFARAEVALNSVGATPRALMILSRRDAEDPDAAQIVRAARCCYLIGGSPLHLRSVLKDSAVLLGLVNGWADGALVAGTAAGAMALSDPMVDPRGGAFTVGLGLVRNIAVLTDFDKELTPSARRTIALAPKGCSLVALTSSSMLVRDPVGTWRDVGEEPAVIYEAGVESGLEVLAGKPTM